MHTPEDGDAPHLYSSLLVLPTGDAKDGFLSYFWGAAVLIWAAMAHPLPGPCPGVRCELLDMGTALVRGSAVTPPSSRALHW